MNNLGLSSNGNPFQLVPPSQRHTMTKNYKATPTVRQSELKFRKNDPLQAFLNGDVKQLEKSFQSKQFVTQPDKTQNKDLAELEEMLSKLKKTKNTPSSDNKPSENGVTNSRNEVFMSNIRNNIKNESTPLPKIASGKSNEWTKIFQNVCLHRFKNFFIDLKSLIQKQSIFNDTNLCFINQDQMRKLVQYVKSSKDTPNYPVMSLRMYLSKYTNNPFSLKDSSDLEKLINTVELFGPPDHVLIALGQKEIDMLNQGKTHKFWPYGDEGVTWIN